MKCPGSVFQFSSPVTMHFSGFTRRSGGDTRMWDMFVEYADIATADEPLGRIKARLAALSDFAESQGLTGQAAFDGLRRLNADLHGELMDTRGFSLFYRFVFFMCRERGQKSISVNTAVDAWRLSLPGRFRLLDQWCAFVKIRQRHAISEDTWRQVLEFSRSVHEDLSNYDPEGAWPVLVDEFVDNMYRKATCQMCSTGSSVLCECGMDLLTKLSPDDKSGTEALSSKTATLPGMAASAGSKRRRGDPKDAAAQVESVNSIAQLFAEMPSPVSCKRVRSGVCTAELQDVMEASFDAQERENSHSVDEDMLSSSGSIHGSPYNRMGSYDVFYPLSWQPWHCFDGRGGSGPTLLPCTNPHPQGTSDCAMKHTSRLAVRPRPYL